MLVDGVSAMDRPEFPKAFGGGVKSTAVVKELLKHEHDMDWTVLSPPMAIVPGERTGKFRLGLDELLAMAMIDELEQPRHIGRRFTVGC